MAKMMAHVPETDELAVTGVSATDSLAAQAARPISLQEVLARLAETKPDVAERYSAVAAAAKQRDAAAAAAALQVCALACVAAAPWRYLNDRPPAERRGVQSSAPVRAWHTTAVCVGSSGGLGVAACSSRAARPGVEVCRGEAGAAVRGREDGACDGSRARCRHRRRSLSVVQPHTCAAGARRRERGRWR